MQTLKLHRFPFFAMGTQCEVQLYARNKSMANSIALLGINEVLRIEAKYSRYRHDSVLSKINRQAELTTPFRVDDETAQLLDYSFACQGKSSELFDITSGVLRKAWDFSSNRLPEQHLLDALLPLVGMEKLHWEHPYLTFEQPGMEIDFGGVAKEYAADQAATVCLAAGVEHGLIELGGDIKVIGPHPDGSPWIIGIRHPRKLDEIMDTLEIAQGAIATSGNYERYILVDNIRYSHILDPHTGWPVRGLSSVSVITEQCLVAGSVATIAMLKGHSGKEWLAEMGLPHLWMDETGDRGGHLLNERQDR